MPIETVADARTLVFIVEGGSLSAAARALNVSPNAISQRIRALEKRAGVRLINRTTRSMSMTEEGESLYRRCLRILAEVDAAEADLAPTTDRVTGRVRLGLPTLLSGAATLGVLRELRAGHPGLRVQVIVTDDLDLDLVGRGIDLAFHYGEPVESDLIARRLGTTAFGLCATPGYLDAHGRPRTPEDLAAHNGLRFLGGLPQDVWPLVGPQGRIVEAPVGGWFECDNSRMLGEAVYAGLGIGPRPEREIDASEQVERVLPEYEFGRAPLVALMLPGRHRLTRVRVVLDALRDVFAESVLAASASPD